MLENQLFQLQTWKRKPRSSTPQQEKSISKWHKDEEVDACIIYYVTKEGETCVDVEISDYENKTINNLCLLLEAISDEASFLDTLEMIKKGFLSGGREELFLTVATFLIERANLAEILTKEAERPCIRPSDVL